MEVESSSDDCVPLSNMRKRTKKIPKIKTLQSSRPKIMHDTNGSDNLSDVGNSKDDDNSMCADSNDDESCKFNND